MIDAILKWFGYYRIEYGFSCGRHWMKIGGKTIAQTPADDVWLRDEDVNDLAVGVLGSRCVWKTSSFRDLREAEQRQNRQRCANCGEPFKWHRYIPDLDPHCPNIDADRVARGWLEQRFRSEGTTVGDAPK